MRTVFRSSGQDSVAEKGVAAAVGVPFAAIVLAMLPAVLDQTILATALPTIATNLGSITDVAWVVTAYVMAAASMLSCIAGLRPHSTSASRRGGMSSTNASAPISIVRSTTERSMASGKRK